MKKHGFHNNNFQMIVRKHQATPHPFSINFTGPRFAAVGIILCADAIKAYSELNNITGRKLVCINRNPLGGQCPKNGLALVVERWRSSENGIEPGPKPERRPVNERGDRGPPARPADRIRIRVGGQ